MEMLLEILVFLFAIMLLVLVHELGHFWVARRCGIKVLKFSIGFGKPLWRHIAKDGVEYVVTPVLLGGYVKFLDTREGPVKKSELAVAFDKQPFWSRFLVVLAGPVTNLLFALAAFWLILVIGFEVPKPIIGEVIPQSIATQAKLQPGDQLIKLGAQRINDWSDAVMTFMQHLGDVGSVDLLVKNKQQALLKRKMNLSNWQINNLKPEVFKSLGFEPFRPFIPSVIDKVAPGSAAERAGLLVGDKILAADGVVLESWIDIVKYLRERPRQKIDLLIERDGEQLQLTIIPDQNWQRFRKVGKLGIAPLPIVWPKDSLTWRQFSVINAALPALNEVWQFGRFNLIIMAKLFSGKISLHVLGGPIAIFHSADQAFRQGVAIYIGFLALLSVMLAIVNLLPVPGLDGGHLLFLIIQGLIGREVPLRVQALALRLGMVLLFMLIIKATYNDVMRMF